MRALILAAGRGERLRPLTDTTPKPLLRAGGRRLIEWQILALVRAGITDIVINTAHLADRFEDALADGSGLGAQLRYSREGDHATDALETLGGILKAAPLLGDSAFAVVSGDICTTFDYAQLHVPARRIDAGECDAHLVLVPNPPYHPGGDMLLVTAGGSGAVALPPGADAAPDRPMLTYANIGVFAPRLFAGEPVRREKLFPWMFRRMQYGRTSAQRWDGAWWNIGTQADLLQLDHHLAATRS